MPRTIPRDRPSIRRSLEIVGPFHLRTPVAPPVSDGSPLWALAYQAELAMLDGPPVVAYAIDPATATITATVHADVIPDAPRFYPATPIALPDGGMEFLAGMGKEVRRVLLDAGGKLVHTAKLAGLSAIGGDHGFEMQEAGDARVVASGDVVSCVEPDGALRWRIGDSTLVDVTARFAVLSSRFVVNVYDLATGALVVPIALPDRCSLQVWRRADCLVLGEDPFREEEIYDADMDRERTAMHVRVIDLETGNERFDFRGGAPFRFPDAPVLFVRARDRAFQREERCYDVSGRAVTHRVFERPDGTDSRIVGIDDESMLVLDGDTLTCEVLADPREVRWQLALGPSESPSSLDRVFFPFGEAIAMVESFGRRVTFLSTR